jgi:hypothetical protein
MPVKTATNHVNTTISDELTWFLAWPSSAKGKSSATCSYRSDCNAGHIWCRYTTEGNCANGLWNGNGGVRTVAAVDVCWPLGSFRLVLSARPTEEKGHVVLGLLNSPLLLPNANAVVH